MEEILPLILVLLAIALVMYLSYIFTKFVSNRSTKTNAANYMRIVDRLVVGQDRYIMIIEIQNKFFLVSVTAQEIHILKELEEFDELPPVEGGTKSFSESFKTVLNNMMSKNK